MKNIIVTLLLIAGCGMAECQTNQLLTPEVFAKRLHETPDGQLVDVRTPEEFQKGHLKNALNMNINSSDLEKRAPYLDKEKPLFVYCYMGGRSAKACEYFKKMGFKIIYDMQGGYSAWTDANLPVENRNTLNAGINMEQFNLLKASGKVLVDINAPWCAPCVKMKPTLDSLETAWKGNVKILRFNKDDNQQLAKTLEATELPSLYFFNDGKLVRKASGYKDAAALTDFVK
ncbi:MAG: thioredoxin domain-containing protein [Bacteroidia bacterium]